jgi:translation elongation factor EF-1alpha
MKVLVMPTRNTYHVDTVWACEIVVSVAQPGESVVVRLSGAKTEDVWRGYVLCIGTEWRAANKVIFQIAAIDMPDYTRVMTAGFPCIFHAHIMEIECTVTKIFETTNREGHVMKNARFVCSGVQVVVMMELAQPVVVQTYDHTRHWALHPTNRRENRRHWENHEAATEKK